MSEEKKVGYLGFNEENNRFGILSLDIWVDEGLHCGECLEVWNDETEQWVNDRLEMKNNGEWYLVGLGLAGDNLERVRVKY